MVEDFPNVIFETQINQPICLVQRQVSAYI